ncbi:MAG: hypothetical protein FWD70_04025, partial [Desulfuromonadales bacterium]|nr:hypothetical protein [Desulfuromonadales bacterium]
VNYNRVCILTVKYATQDGQQLTSSFRMTVQQTDMAKLIPGYKMPIEYDPQKPQNIKFVPYAASSTLQAAKDQYDLTHGEITQEFIDIRDKGTKAKGVILASKPTGNIMDNKSEMELQVKVTRPDGSTYEVNTTKDVPQTGLSFAAPGSIVHVFYMPDNEQNIMIGFYT